MRNTDLKGTKYVILTLIWLLYLVAQECVVSGALRTDKKWTKSLQKVNVTYAYHKETKAVELLLTQKEFESTNNLFRKLTAQGYTIKGYYHVSKFRDKWREVVTEQLYLLDGKRKLPGTAITHHTLANLRLEDVSDPYTWSYDHQKRWTSLLQASVGLYMNIASEELTTAKDFKDFADLISTLQLESGQKIELHVNVTLSRSTYKKAATHEKQRLRSSISPVYSEGEYSTINALQDYCENVELESPGSSEKSLVFYLHNKGSCCTRDRDQLNVSTGVWRPNPEAGWREEMNAFNIEFPSICLRALIDHNYSTCGVDNHYSIYAGNFWWARCSHIRLLPRISNRFDSYEAERIIFNVSRDFRTVRRFAII
jgi:hypothetical protein